MKKMMIFVIVLLFLSSAYAFDKGTINAGGGLSFSSTKANSDADAATNFLLAVKGGYFIMDNLSLDLVLQYSSWSQGDYDDSSTALGLGGRYFFMDKFYAGPAFLHTSSGDSDWSSTANFLKLEAGYLHPLVENVYLDFGVNYQMGFGEYGGDGAGDNEETAFNIAVGLEFFFMNQ